MTILGLYLLLCAPGLIAALIVRLWARRRKLDLSARASLVGGTVGLFCSPGFHVAGYGVPVVIPSLYAALMAEGERPKMWLIFLASSAVTATLASIVYAHISQRRGKPG
jgi:hypothetical protein